MRKPSLIVFLAGMVLSAVGMAEPGDVYVNRAPLEEAKFMALPLGSVKPRGWLRHQLELQKHGLTGHAHEVLDAVISSRWTSEEGEDWEKGPYFLKGLVPLAWGLEDEALQQQARVWMDAILDGQGPNGFYGPKTNDDWWPRMVVNYVLRDFHEATGDPRVIPFLTKYYHHLHDSLNLRPLKDWGRSRAGDEIDTIFWLYNRTGETFLIDLAKQLEIQSLPWSEIFSRNTFLDYPDFQPRHNVNIPQALKMPVVFSQLSKNPQHANSYIEGLRHLDRDHGLSVGLNSGTEFLSGNSTTQGIELCSIVERMLSDATILRITGSAARGDSLERMAFNALPGSLSPNIHQHVYYCLPNNVIAKRGLKGFDQDYPNGTTPAHMSGFHCCCYNFHMGWPKFVQNSWAATPGEGLAVLAYGPTAVTARVGKGRIPVTITEETDYPFTETVKFRLSSPEEVEFPLMLRIPAWCTGAKWSMKGKESAALAGGTFTTIRRVWKDGDEVTLTLPMAPRVESGLNESVSISRGPLLFSLEVKERREVYAEGPIPGYEAYELHPDSPWNYGLVIDPEKPEDAVKVTVGEVGEHPFDRAQTPVKMTIKGQKIPGWTLAYGGMVALDPPMSPVASSEPEEKVTLVPFGAGMLRVTNFPVIGEPAPLPTSFTDSFHSEGYGGWITYGGSWHVKDGALRTASHTNSGSRGVQGVKAVVPSAVFKDFVYEGRVTLTDSGDAGLIFRVSGPAIGPDSYRGYYAGVSTEKNEVLIGIADHGWKQLRAAPMTIDPSRQHHIRVEARGSRIRVFVNEMMQPKLEIEDETFREGMIGVRRFNIRPEKNGSGFSNIRATKL